MRIRVARVVLDMQRLDVPAEQTERLVLRHFLQIPVTDVPNGVEKRMVDVFDEREQIGRVVDPVHPVDAHTVEIFHQHVEAVFFGSLEQRHKEFAVPPERLFARDAARVAGMHHHVGDAQLSARVDTL